MTDARKVNGLTFLQWVNAVDRLLESLPGESDFDNNYAEWHSNWECGTTPEHMAHALRADASTNEVRADTERADTEPSFREWMRQVNVEVLRISGVTTADIGDAAYRDNFDAGVSPREMAIEALEQSDFPFEEA